MLRLYDTFSRELQEISPSNGKDVRFYCCGPTVYASAHIGNFRTFLVQDLFRRVLELADIPVQHVRNITDVDDKTIERCLEEKKTLKDLTSYWTDYFHSDCAKLAMLPPHIEPFATDHIEKQKELIQNLLEKGIAYISSGSIYFSCQDFPEYGKLCGKERLENALNEESENREKKKHPADFVLWKAHQSTDGSIFWESPWGKGRPGWHLECTVMALEHLGTGIDWHSGGVDLAFPHHENEIAQAEAALECCFSNHWFHIEHLLVDGVKMSKSIGNLYTLEDIEKRGYTVGELRHALLNGHYRKQLNFTFRSLENARANLLSLSRFYRKLLSLSEISCPQGYEEFSALFSGRKLKFFREALAILYNDLNVPLFLGQIFQDMKKISINLEKYSLSERNTLFLDFCFLSFLFGWDLQKFCISPRIPQEIQNLAENRWKAKLKKNWEAADKFRAEVEKKGWKICDKDDNYEILSL